MPQINHDINDAIAEAEAELEQINLLRSIRAWLAAIWITLAVICGTLIQMVGHGWGLSGYIH